MESQDNKERSLTSPLLLVAIALVFGTLLILLFPTPDVFSRWATIGKPDSLSIAYLKALVLSHPEDVGLRLAYARQLKTLGRWEDAREALAPVLDVEDERVYEAIQLELELLLGLMYAAHDGTELRAQRRRTLHEALQATRVQRLPCWVALPIAKTAAAAGAVEVAVSTYTRCARQVPEKGLWCVTRAERALVAESRHEEVVELYLEAATWERAGHLRSAYIVRAVDYLMMLGDLPRAARILALESEAHPSRAVLEKAIEVARAEADVESIVHYSRRLAILAAYDIKVIARLRDLELANGNLYTALGYARRVVELAPNDAEERERMAEVAEWAGVAELALEAWAWLARVRSDDDDIDRTIRISRQVWNQTLLLEALLIRAAKGTISKTYTRDIVAVFEALGLPGEAVKWLRARARQYPKDEHAHRMLVSVLARSGRLAEALSAWGTIRTRFGWHGKDWLRVAGIQMKLRAYDDALATLRSAASVGGKHRGEAMRQYGELAYFLEATSDGIRAYEGLVELGQASFGDRQRLLDLYYVTGRPRAYVSLATSLFTEQASAGLYSAALGEAVGDSNWAAVERLLALGAEGGLRPEMEETYWYAQLALSRRRGTETLTKYALEKLVTLRPDATAYQSDLLWWMIQRRDPRLLARLNQYERKATVPDVLWPALAAGYRALGQAPQALPWYEAQLEENPGDWRVQLQYLGALEESGHRAKAEARSEVLLAELDRMRGAPRDGSARALAAAGNWIPIAGRDPYAGSGSMSPAAVRFAATWHLDHAAPDLARPWVDIAEETPGLRATVPRWRLRLAVLDADPEAVRRVVASPGGAKLPADDRFHAFQAVGLEASALRTALGCVRSTCDELSALRFRRAAEDLMMIHHDRVGADERYMAIGGMTSLRTRVDGRISKDGIGLGIQAEHERVHWSSLGGSRSETALWGSLESRLGGARLMLDAGMVGLGNRAVPMGRMTASWQAAAGLAVVLKARTGERADQAESLRLSAMWEGVGVEVWRGLGENGYISATGGWEQYLTRDRSPIGQLARIEANAGYAIRFKGVQTVLRSTFQYNRRFAMVDLDAVPVGAVAVPVPPGGLLPGEPVTVGLGLRSEFGRWSVVPSLLPQTIWFVDGWAGWVLPIHRLAYDVRGGVGVPLFGNDQLSAVVGFGGRNDVLAGQIRRSAELRYTYRFWP